VLQMLLQILTKYLKVEQQLTAGTNQLRPIENNVIPSRLSLGPISLRHPEFYDFILLDKFQNDKSKGSSN